MIKAIGWSGVLFHTKHSFPRKLGFALYILGYRLTTLGMMYFSPAIYYIYLHGILVTTQYTFKKDFSGFLYLRLVCEGLYLLILIVNIVKSLSNERPASE